MAPTKEHDTAHLDKFSAEELEDILVQLCDSEGVKVSADDDKALKNIGKNALGGLGKKLFGKGDGKKEPQSPTSPDEPPMPAEPEAPAPAPARPASDVIRELNLGDKQGLIEVLQNILASVLTGDNDGKTGGNPLFACFGKLLKGGGSNGNTKSRNAVESSAQIGEAQTDGASAAGDAAAPSAMPGLEDIKTPEALFKFITTNQTVKTLVISGVQTFLAKAMQGGQAAKS